MDIKEQAIEKEMYLQNLDVEEQSYEMAMWDISQQQEENWKENKELTAEQEEYMIESQLERIRELREDK